MNDGENWSTDPIVLIQEIAVKAISQLETNDGHSWIDQFVRHPDAGVRAIAVWAVTRLSSAHEEVGLDEIQDDSSNVVQDFLKEYFSSVSPKPERPHHFSRMDELYLSKCQLSEATACVVAAANSANKSDRVHAYRMIWLTKLFDARVSGLVAKGLQDEYWLARLPAVESSQYLGLPNESLRVLLSPLRNDPDEVVRSRVCEILDRACS